MPETYTKSQLAHTLGFSRSLFYHTSSIDVKDTATADNILRLHEVDDTLGVKKLCKILNIGKPKCRRVMKKYNISPRKHTNTNYVYPGKSDVIFPNLLLENGIQTTDIYYSDIFEFVLADNTKVYGCFVLKKATRQILAILFDYSKDAYLVKSTLEQASLFVLEGGVFHSDQGKQYGAQVHVAYVQMLALKLSMSRAGTPTDNPFAERFVGVFKLAVVYKRKYFTLGDFLDQAFRWLDFYLNIRPHEGINMKAPNVYAAEIGQKVVSLNQLFRV